MVGAVQRDRSRLEQENGRLKEHIAALHNQLSALGVAPVENHTVAGVAVNSVRTSNDVPGSTTPDHNTKRGEISGRNSPRAAEMRIVELEAQLSNTRQREADLRQRLEASEAEVQHAFCLAQV